MGFRFRRSVKILPGVRLNFGTRGISTSIGVRGAHVTFGRTGTRTTVGLPGSGISYTHLENRHRLVPITGGTAPPIGPVADQGSPLRGVMWIALIVAIVGYGIGKSTNSGPSVQAPTLMATNTAAQAAIKAAQDAKVADVRMAAVGVAQIRGSVANSRTLTLSRVVVMPDGTTCYHFRLENSRGIPYIRAALMSGAVAITSGSEGFNSLWNSRCAHENDGRDITSDTAALIRLP